MVTTKHWIEVNRFSFKKAKIINYHFNCYITNILQLYQRYRPARLDLHESGIIGKPFKRTSTAIYFIFFIFDLEYLIRVQSSEPLHAKMNPISCLFGSRFAYLQAAILSIFNLIKLHASRNLLCFFPIGWFVRFGRFCRLFRTIHVKQRPCRSLLFV